MNIVDWLLFATWLVAAAIAVRSLSNSVRQYRALREVRRERRILALTRFAHAEHKGVDLVPRLIGEAMRGYTLVFMVGVGNPSDQYLEPIRAAAAKHGVKIEILEGLDEYGKWREFKRASLVLFPSFFEGFGLPPLEARYAGTPCVAFDLPVLREVSGDQLFYVPCGDVDAMRHKAEEILRSGEDFSYLHKNFGATGTFEDFATRVDIALSRALHEGCVQRRDLAEL